MLREAYTKERELQNSKAPLDVTDFLEPVGVWELKHIRKLSSLTGLTYFMHLVTVSIAPAARPSRSSRPARVRCGPHDQD